MIKINSLEGYKDIKDYYSMYKENNIVIFKNEKTGKFIKPFIKKNKGNGYLYIKLNTVNKPKNIRINRIIAIAYIKNTGNNNINNLQVHHKDHNKANNNINNLEWTTRKRNIFYYKYFKTFVPGQISLLDEKQIKKYIITKVNKTRKIHQNQLSIADIC